MSHELVDFCDQVAAALTTALAGSGLSVAVDFDPEIRIKDMAVNARLVLVYPYGEETTPGSRNDRELSHRLMVSYVAKKPGGDAAAIDTWTRARLEDVRLIRVAVGELSIDGGAIGDTSSTPLYDIDRLKTGVFHHGLVVEIEYDDVDD